MSRDQIMKRYHFERKRGVLDYGCAVHLQTVSAKYIYTHFSFWVDDLQHVLARRIMGMNVSYQQCVSDGLGDGVERCCHEIKVMQLARDRFSSVVENLELNGNSARQRPMRDVMKRQIAKRPCHTGGIS